MATFLKQRPAPFPVPSQQAPVGAAPVSQQQPGTQCLQAMGQSKPTGSHSCPKQAHLAQSGPCRSHTGCYSGNRRPELRSEPVSQRFQGRRNQADAVKQNNCSVSLSRTVQPGPQRTQPHCTQRGYQAHDHGRAHHSSPISGAPHQLRNQHIA